jgi:hypothetical protein
VFMRKALANISDSFLHGSSLASTDVNALGWAWVIAQ